MNYQNRFVELLNVRTHRQELFGLKLEINPPPLLFRYCQVLLIITDFGQGMEGVHWAFELENGPSIGDRWGRMARYGKLTMVDNSPDKSG